jgi:hypothetical protein
VYHGGKIQQQLVAPNWSTISGNKAEQHFWECLAVEVRSFGGNEESPPNECLFEYYSQQHSAAREGSHA